jgi:4-oxalocrotonate tautomerase
MESPDGFGCPGEARESTSSVEVCPIPPAVHARVRGSNRSHPTVEVAAFRPVPFDREESMPYVNIQILKGATREAKANLVRDVTDSLVRELGKRPEHVHVVIQEIEESDWGFEGLLTDEWKARQRGS